MVEVWSYRLGDAGWLVEVAEVEGEVVFVVARHYVVDKIQLIGVDMLGVVTNVTPPDTLSQTVLIVLQLKMRGQVTMWRVHKRV